MLARLVDILAGQAEIPKTWRFRSGNATSCICRPHLTPLLLGVVKLAGLVDFLVRKAEVGNRRKTFRLGRFTLRSNLTPLLLGIAKLARLVDFLVRQAKVGSSCRKFSFGSYAKVTTLPNLTPLLRGVVLFGEAALGGCLYVERIRLGAMRRLMPI